MQAWEAFAMNYQTHKATRAKLQQLHFLIAEIGLTTQTLRKKLKDKEKSLLLGHRHLLTAKRAGRRRRLHQVRGETLLRRRSFGEHHVAVPVGRDRCQFQ